MTGRISGQLPASVAPVSPSEPPPGSVIQFKIKHAKHGPDYDYAALRAGNGLWYITGGETKQGVDWGTLIDAIRPRIVGPLWVLSGRQGFTL